MKKVLALLLSAAMALGVAGCSQGETNVSDASSSDASAASSEADAAEDLSWSKVEDAGVLVVGLDDAFPPMGYKDTQTGELIGFDIDLAKEACSRLGVELQLQPIDWDSKQFELDNGNVDCLWNGFSWTEDRAESFNLSIPYMKNDQVLLIKTDAAYTSLEDLAGKTIGVQADSSAEVALNKEANKALKDSLKEVVRIDDYSKAVLEIQNGTIDAIAIDSIVARFYLKNDPGAYKILGEDQGEAVSLEKEDYVVGFRKADEALKLKVEEALKAMDADGTLKTISENWFQEDITTIGE